MASDHESDPMNLPVKYPGPSTDLKYFTREWWSGRRGGGRVPADFSWPTNPKQKQEENGSGDAEQPISK